MSPTHYVFFHLPLPLPLLSSCSSKETFPANRNSRKKIIKEKRNQQITLNRFHFPRGLKRTTTLLHYTHCPTGEKSALSGLPKKGSPCHARTGHRCTLPLVPRPPANNAGDSVPLAERKKRWGIREALAKGLPYGTVQEQKPTPEINLEGEPCYHA
ncbi:hypothetical protein HOY80DRAFT_272623 [Tuber brumale]|nr:hypothetical protein HOY80DRAFT_272623 [Tuber brumale]